MAVASLYTAVAELLAGLELAVRLGVVLVHVLQEVRSQGRWEWMRKIGVDRNKKEFNPNTIFVTSLSRNGRRNRTTRHWSY